MKNENRLSMSVEKVRRIFDLDPVLGLLRWKHNPDRPKKWNTRWAGKIAGGVSGPYLSIRVDDDLYRTHRLIWLHYYGEEPPEHIDHINGKKLDNRIVNLRAATRSDNLCNRAIQSNNVCGFKGIRYREHHKKWEGRINKNGKTVWRKYFDNPQEASAARNVELIKIHGDFAKNR